MHDIVIEAGRTERQYWHDLWRYRELFFFLTWKDILVRYKQTVVGAAWAILRPLVIMLVMTFVFGRLADMPSGGAPYPILVFCGVLPWQFFSTAVSESGNSLVSNTSLISKIYFPRMTIPASTIGTSLVDFCISGVLMAVLMAWYRFVPGARIVALPLLLMIALCGTLGVGLWLSALTVRYRDFRHVIPFVSQLGMYLSPVGFTSDVVPAQWRLVYSLNPMVGVIDGFRWAILGDTSTLYVPGFLLSTAVGIVLLVTGVRYFRATERTFADVI